MPDWIRRPYTGIGLTQSPPGRHLSALQARFCGSVLLCIDVSGSMACADDGARTRLAHACAGAERFVAEALAANYATGLILWHHNVAGFVPLTRDAAPVLAALRSAVASGGNDITHTLTLGMRELAGRTGDRVLAIFGDGDIGPVQPSLVLAKKAHADGIRIIVRGLGEHAAAALGAIASDPAETAVVASIDGLATGISSMVASMTALGRRGGS